MSLKKGEEAWPVSRQYPYSTKFIVCLSTRHRAFGVPWDTFKGRGEASLRVSQSQEF
jgi:hypothetical protein